MDETFPTTGHRQSEFFTPMARPMSATRQEQTSAPLADSAGQSCFALNALKLKQVRPRAINDIGDDVGTPLTLGTIRNALRNPSAL